MQSGGDHGDRDSEWRERTVTGPRDCKGHGQLCCFQGHIKSGIGGEYGGERPTGHHVPTAPECQHT